MHVLAHLVTEAGGNLLQLDAAAFAITGQRFQRLGDLLRTDVLVFVEQVAELVQGHRLGRCQQGGLDDGFELIDLHGFGSGAGLAWVGRWVHSPGDSASADSPACASSAGSSAGSSWPALALT
ncbi:hypothetical protein RLIN73S_01087 [Rhodanobacter lindaniclasticus]